MRRLKLSGGSGGTSRSAFESRFASQATGTPGDRNPIRQIQLPIVRAEEQIAQVFAASYAALRTIAIDPCRGKAAPVGSFVPFIKERSDALYRR